MRTMIVHGARIAYLVIAWLFVAGILFQVLLVGLVIFTGWPTWEAHMSFGHFLGSLPLLLVILSFVSRLSRPGKGLVGLLFGVYFFQAEVFAGIRGEVPVLAALHPVLALVLFWLAVTIAQQARSLVQEPQARKVFLQ